MDTESKSMFRNDVEYQDYPAWSKSVDDINAQVMFFLSTPREVNFHLIQNHINHGKWSSIEGPPFVQRITLYSGSGVDITHGGNIVRKVVGIPKNFGKWEGNRFLANFDSQQMRFFQSNKNSALVIPPLSEGNLPILSDYAKGMLKHYVALGHNTLIICGGPASVDFINQNLYSSSEGTTPALVTEDARKACDGTPFQSLPVTLPTMKGHVHGVRTVGLAVPAACQVRPFHAAIASSGRDELLRDGRGNRLVS
eukprot:754826-Hanusia_phi.AAC.8